MTDINTTTATVTETSTVKTEKTRAPRPTDRKVIKATLKAHGLPGLLAIVHDCVGNRAQGETADRKPVRELVEAVSLDSVMALCIETVEEFLPNRRGRSTLEEAPAHAACKGLEAARKDLAAGGSYVSKVRRTLKTAIADVTAREATLFTRNERFPKWAKPYAFAVKSEG